MKRKRISRTYPHRRCANPKCRILLSDGYCEDCETCQNRRIGRRARGEDFTPTGYANEFIDNRDPKGRLTSA